MGLTSALASFGEAAPLVAVSQLAWLVALVFAILAVVFVGPPEKPDAVARWPLYGIGASAGVALAALISVVVRGGRLIAPPLVGSDEAASRFAYGISLQIQGAMLLGLSALAFGVLIALLLAGRVARIAARRRAFPLLGATLGAAAAAVAFVAAGAVLSYAWAARDVFSGVAAVDPSVKSMLCEDGLEEAGQRLAIGKRALAIVRRASRPARRTGQPPALCWSSPASASSSTVRPTPTRAPSPTS